MNHMKIRNNPYNMQIITSWGQQLVVKYHGTRKALGARPGTAYE
jgi:hypothetical protein